MKDKAKYLKYILLGVLIICVIGVITFALKKDSDSQSGKNKEDIFVTEKNTENSAQEEEEATEQVKEIETGSETFVIFGVDTRATNLGKGTRSDSIMVADVNHETKEIRVASIFRDCYVSIDGHGMDKINHAHSFGGPELAIQTVNKNFDLNIEKYITVNFINVSELVDEIGGIEMDITSEECKYINSYIDEINRIEGASSPHITEPGNYTLDGVQAVAYTRIRYTAGGDYKRAERQRTILFKIFEKAQELDNREVITLVEEFMDEINTNYQSEEVTSMLYYLSKYKMVDTKAFPTRLWGGKVDGVWYGVPVTLESNVVELHQFLYPNAEYTVSDTVKEISNRIEQVASTPNEVLE